MDLFFSVECTTYIESLCTQKCHSISKAVKEFNMQSTCPCQCTCSEFIPSRCETDCQNKIKLRYQDQQTNMAVSIANVHVLHFTMILVTVFANRKVNFKFRELKVDMNVTFANVDV